VMAADYIALNQPDETQKLIGEILRQCASDPTLVPQLATLFLRRKMAGDANELMRIAAARQKVTAEFLAVLARVQAANGNSEEAKGTLARALAMDSSQPEVLLAQALEQGGSGDWKGAVASLNKSRQVDPPTDEVLRRLAYACLQIDDLMTAHDAAIELYDRNPRRSDSAFTLAIVFVRASHWGEAKPLLQHVLGEMPNDKRAQLALGIVQFNLGDIANAQQLLSASLGQGQSDAEAHYMLGLIVKQNGDFAAAAGEMEAALKIDPEKPEALSSLGQLYLQLDKTEQAKAILERAIQKRPEDAQDHYQLGVAYRKLGDSDKARQEMETFRRLSARKIPQPTGEAASSRP